jgi:hypothetical protein
MRTVQPGGTGGLVVVTKLAGAGLELVEGGAPLRLFRVIFAIHSAVIRVLSVVPIACVARGVLIGESGQSRDGKRGDCFQQFSQLMCRIGREPAVSALVSRAISWNTACTFALSPS